MNIKKIGIVGCGFVGSTIAYTLMESGLFTEMVLVDKNAEKACGEAMDLNHCLPFLAPMTIYESGYEGLRDASIVVIAAGANQKPGETRIDLLQRNIAVFREVVQGVTAVNRECILLVVTNPVDLMTSVTRALSGFPANRVIGSGTVLDTARLKYLMGRRLQVDSRNVHTFIIGEHGDSELAVWSSANVSGIDLTDYCALWEDVGTLEGLRGIFDHVKNSAYEIIRAKGATYYAIAQATKRIITAIVNDEHAILPVTALLEGQYDLEDICLSVPAVVGASGIEHVLDIPLNDAETERLRMAASKLRRCMEEASFSVDPVG